MIVWIWLGLALAALRSLKYDATAAWARRMRPQPAGVTVAGESSLLEDEESDIRGADSQF